MDESYLIDLNEGYTSIPLLTLGDEIPLLEGEFPFLATDPNAAFPVDNLGEVDSGDNPLFPSATETFTFPGNFDGVSHTKIDGTNYVFVNHSLDPSATTEGPVNGSRISLLAFDEDWNIIGGRNLVNIVRIASIEANNALRAAGIPGLILAQYKYNPATGNYEANLEAGVVPGETFISGNEEFLASESDVPGQTWLERLEDSFPTIYNSLQIPGLDNYPNLSSTSIAETGFRRRAGQALPFIFNGDGVGDGVAHFHIANGISVPILGFGAFARSQVISALDFRPTVNAEGVPFGQTILLSSEASPDDAELYMWVGDRAPGNTNGLVDFEDNLYVLKVTDGAGTVIADETMIAEGTTLAAEWVLVDGNPLNNVDEIPEGNAINTLNSEDLSDWVNGADNGVLRSTDFNQLGGIAEDPNDLSTFYFTSTSGLYSLTFAPDSPTGIGNITLLETGNFDSVAVDDDGKVIVQNSEGLSLFYDIEEGTLTLFVEDNQAGIDPSGLPPWLLKGITEVDDNYNNTGLSAYLTNVAANSLTDSVDSLGVGGQLLLNVPTAASM